MPRKIQEKVHYIYKITNLINEKFYIGMHSCSKGEQCKYMGSGRMIKRSIAKHGIENFSKQILEYCQDRDELAKREKEIICDELLKDPTCMNISYGGLGGIQNDEHLGKLLKAVSEKRKTDPSYQENLNRYFIEMIKQRHKDGKMTYFKDNYDWKGKKHKPETIEKMKKSKNVGSENSQFGSRWINNGIEAKKINNRIIPEGWKFGRKIS